MDQALEDDPKLQEPVNGLCVAYARSKKSQQAISYCRKARGIEPNVTMIYYLAWSYLDLKKFPEAINALQECVRLDPNRAAVYTALAEGHYFMKRPKEAKKFFEKALTIDPKSALARYNLAMTCLALNQRDCAREQYSILKHVEPGLSTQLLDHMYSSKVLRLVK